MNSNLTENPVSEKLKIFLKAFLLPALLVVFFMLHYFHEMLAWDFSPSSLSIAILYGWMLALIFFVSLRALCRDEIRTALVTTFILGFVFFFEELRKIIGHLPILESILHRYKYLLPFFLFIIIVLIIYMRRSSSDFKKVFNVLRIFFLIMILIESGKLAWFGMKEKETEQKVVIINNDPMPQNLPAVLPDVYYLVFDSRTSPEALKKYWNYDDSAFVNDLEKRGFKVLKNARSNYNSTLPSISTTLNMEYAGSMRRLPPQLNSHDSVSLLVTEARAIRLFRKMGYDIRSLTHFGLPGSAFPADRNFKNTFLNRIWYKSLFGKIWTETGISLLIPRSISPHYSQIDEKENIIFRYKKYILNSAREERSAPRFLYVHFMVPHFPFLFDRKGNEVVVSSTFSKSASEQFLDQLIFTNTFALGIIDSLLLADKREKIILLQGDHGYRYLKDDIWKSEEAGCILNAFYIGGKSVNLYEGMTPVNSFRFLMDSVYNFKYGFLDDKPYSLGEKSEEEEID